MRRPGERGEDAYRQRVEDELTADRSWLTVADLHFLTVRDHVVGSGEDADLRLPDRFSRGGGDGFLDG